MIFFYNWPLLSHIEQLKPLQVTNFRAWEKFRLAVLDERLRMT